MDNKVAIIVGRFAPLHNGHCDIINQAYKLFSDVMIVVGSANLRERTDKTPFIIRERLSFVRKVFPHLVITDLDDVNNINRWLFMLDEKVASFFPDKNPVFIIGRPNEATFYNYTVSMFSPYKDYKRETYRIGASICREISATYVRNRLKNNKSIRNLVRPEIHNDIVTIWDTIISKQMWYLVKECGGNLE